MNEINKQCNSKYLNLILSFGFSVCSNPMNPPDLKQDKSGTQLPDFR